MTIRRRVITRASRIRIRFDANCPPRDAEIVSGTKIVPARRHRADDGNGIRTLPLVEKNQLKRAPADSVNCKDGSKSADSRAEIMDAGSKHRFGRRVSTVVPVTESNL
jgi:hypothetical protein